MHLVPPDPPRHLPALDGLRGVAILLVMIHHFGGNGAGTPHSALELAFQRVIAFGWCGVDCFFVLSGFLITGILCDAKDSPRALRNFYARRALRIFPLYYGVLVFLFILLPTFSPVPLRGVDKVAPLQGWLWLYASNFVSVFNGPGLPFRGGLVQAGHYWSLAVEEQFYLIWPLVVLTCRRQTLTRLCTLVIVGGFCLRLGLAARGFERMYYFTPCRLDGLMAGAWIALALRSGRPIASLVPAARWTALASGGSIAAIGVARGFDIEDPIITTAGFSLFAALFAATLILALAAPATGRLARAFTARPLRFLGKYSYGLYIFHFALTPTFQRLFSPTILTARVFHHYWPSLLAYMTLAGGISVAAAWCSWHGYEKHFLKLKRHFEPAVATRVPDSLPLPSVIPQPMAQAA